MADAVTTNVIMNSADHYIVHLTNVSDGTGESAVVKVDKSTLFANDQAEPASLDIEKIVWNCVGMSVKLLWDHTTDDVATILDGNGSVDFSQVAGGQFGGRYIYTGGLKDPRSAGDTGDILLTTVGHSSGDTYNITLWLRKNPT